MFSVKNEESRIKFAVIMPTDSIFRVRWCLVPYTYIVIIEQYKKMRYIQYVFPVSPRRSCGAYILKKMPAIRNMAVAIITQKMIFLASFMYFVSLHK